MSVGCRAKGVLLAAVAAGLNASGVAADDAAIPNLVGTWVGENRTISDKKGYRVWGEKTVVISEQQDRRFRGHFTYPDGTKNFRKPMPCFQKPMIVTPMKMNAASAKVTMMWLVTVKE